MRRLLLLFICLILYSFVCVSQTEKQTQGLVVPGNDQVKPQMDQPVVYSQIIFSIGKSDDKGIFDKVKLYLDNTLFESVRTKFTCIQQRVFVLDIISIQFKDPADLIQKLKTNFTGTDFLIKQDDNILFNECYGEYIKQL
jgi:hypothetical protein